MSILFASSAVVALAFTPAFVAGCPISSGGIAMATCSTCTGAAALTSGMASGVANSGGGIPTSSGSMATSGGGSSTMVSIMAAGGSGSPDVHSCICGSLPDIFRRHSCD